jgi:RimJ/RimL family protein N-acetyltransferase
MPGPAFATGERVSLHPIEEEDHEFVQYGRNHPSTRIPLTDTRIRTTEDVAERLEDEDKHFLICSQSGSGNSASASESASASDSNSDPEPVGAVGFTWTSEPPKSGDLMYWVAPEHRENGYVTEGTRLFLEYAFAECGFHKVTAHTLVTNEPSIRALESLGFEREGRFRDEQFVDGELVDAYRYGLLADEWLADRRNLDD